MANFLLYSVLIGKIVRKEFRSPHIANGLTELCDNIFVQRSSTIMYQSRADSRAGSSLETLSPREESLDELGGVLADHNASPFGTVRG